MISLNDITELLGLGFFDGDMELAGIVIYVMALIIIFALSRNVFNTLLIAMPVTLIFSMLGVLSTDIMILMIIVTVLGLAYVTRNSWRS